MLHYDIINPLLNDYIARISGEGRDFIVTDAIARLNDFTNFLSSISPDLEFAFFPLKQNQNIGVGWKAFGIGNLCSGTSVKFKVLRNQLNEVIPHPWTLSGFFLNSINNCGEIDFSGVTSDPNFQFRKDPTTLFYFLKHARPKYETSLYRPSTEEPPYFCFDQSPDTYGIVAPCFSKSQFRPKGTTYIYDEIFGGDKKGYAMDFSADQKKKVLEKDPISFYEMDNSEDKFVCISVYAEKDIYTLRSFYGRDYNILTGTFPSPYRVTEWPDGSPRYWFPTRMVIGAGMSNLGSERYDTDGLDHYCPALLILKGDYRDLAQDIAINMADAIGLATEENPNNVSTEKDIINYACSGNITSFEYIQSTPKFISDIKDVMSKIVGQVYGFFMLDLGRWYYDLIGDVGNLVSPTELAEGPRPEIVGSGLVWNGTDNIQRTGISSDGGPLFIYKTGVINANVPKIESLNNRGIFGLVSGILSPDGKFTPFDISSASGFSGFYSRNSLGLPTTPITQFPPYRGIFQRQITGFVSGYIDNNYSFQAFTEDNSKSSGYFINDERFSYPSTGIVPEYITGYISGILKEDGRFEISTGLYKGSGFIKDNQKYEFLPAKIIKPKQVSGFLFGFMAGDGIFSGYDQDNPITGLYSGYFTDGGQEIYFPTGISQVANFDNREEFDSNLGYEFSGFFVEQSGFVGFTDPFVGPGVMTGIIGYKNILEFSGTFSQFIGINELNYGYGNNYSGFFSDVLPTGFSGIEYNFITDEYLTTGSGILTGIIGSINKFALFDLSDGFDNKPYFDSSIGYNFIGFNFPNSGFISDRPKKRERIIGFISGYIDNELKFISFRSLNSPSGSSGYFIENKQYFFPSGSVNFNSFYGSNSNFKYPSINYSGYSFTEGASFSGINSSFFGNGMLTGYVGHVEINEGTGILTGTIGTQNYPELSGSLQGFTGFNFDYLFLRDVSTTFTFYDGSGFSGLSSNSSGIGFLSGLISTGTHFIPIYGDVAGGSGQIISGTGLLTGEIFFVYKTGIIHTGVSVYYDPPKFIYPHIPDYTGFLTGSGFVSGEYPPIIGFISGYRDASGNFSGFQQIEPQNASSGFFLNNFQYYLPSPNNFSGFKYIPQLNTSAGFDFSGNLGSGFFVPNSPGGYSGQTPGSGILTGWLGTRRYLFLNLITGFDYDLISGLVSGNVTGIEYVASLTETGITTGSGIYNGPAGNFSGDAVSGLTSGQIPWTGTVWTSAAGITYNGASADGGPLFVYKTGIIVISGMPSGQDAFGNITGYSGLINDVISGFNASISAVQLQQAEVKLETIATETMAGFLPQIYVFEMFEPFTPIALDTEQINNTCAPEISGLNYFSEIITSATGIDSGYYTVSGIGRVGTYIYPAVIESGYYNISGIALISG